MGQTASIDAVHGRSRANTLKSYSPPLKMYKSPRMSLPEYTLTQYDVKQLMKSYKEALDRGDTHTTSSAESEAEEELMDQIHDQFGPQPRSRSSLQSTKSNASEDSGIDDSTHSPQRSLDDLSSLPVFTKPTVGEDTPMACTPATPMPIPVLFFNQPPEVVPLHHDSELPEPKRRFIPKRLFGKRRKRNDQSERQRSKSVGAVDGSMRSAAMLAQLMDKVHASTTSLASTMSGATSRDPSPTPPIPASINDLKASVRRLSVPLGRAKFVGQRRFSQMVTAIGEVIDQEILMINEGDRPTPLFGSSLLNREWELVTVREMCRRLSLDEIEHLEMPIPEGAAQSQILDELMIRQIMEILPPRAEGYPWVSIYNSEKHGFSLTTLYRKMVEFDEDLSPVLLIVRDTREHVFGAVVSGAIRPADHYTGTGDSCLLWRFLGEAPHTRELRHFNWTGENQFFVNAAKDSLSVGAGGGHYGLWLDADLNHGRSQRCDTFDNEPLAGDKEDFIVQFIEAFGFRM